MSSVVQPRSAHCASPAATAPPGLVLRGLTLRRAGGFCLGPLDLDWPARARVALVGPSGSGKTTLLRLLAGLERADAGSIACGGEPWSDGPRQKVAPAARGIGFVFQDGALWPHMTALQHLRFVDPGASPAAAAALLDRVGLAGFAARKPGDLSGGERQRLGLARALAGQPRILLLDEPLHSVDVHLRDALSLLIREVAAERGLGLVVVTHDRRDAFALATELVVLDAGRVVEAGSAWQIARAPQTAFAAAFLGAATCIPLPPPRDGQVATPFGPLPARDQRSDLVLAVLPGDVRLVAAGTGSAQGRVLRTMPEATGLVASVQLGPHVVQARCDAVVPEGEAVGLELCGPPRVLPRGERGDPA
jgi:iron(III) transport system ATP-binding protein